MLICYFEPSAWCRIRYFFIGMLMRVYQRSLRLKVCTVKKEIPALWKITTPRKQANRILHIMTVMVRHFVCLYPKNVLFFSFRLAWCVCLYCAQKYSRTLSYSNVTGHIFWSRNDLLLTYKLCLCNNCFSLSGRIKSALISICFFIAIIIPGFDKSALRQLIAMITANISSFPLSLAR